MPETKREYGVLSWGFTAVAVFVVLTILAVVVLLALLVLAGLTFS